MKKSYPLFMLCFIGLLLAAQQPITLGNANMPGSGDTLRYTNMQLSSVGNYQQTGANFTWNFGTVASTTSGLRNFKSGIQTPYAFFFLSGSEYGEKIADTLGAGPLIVTNYYDFYKKSTTPNAFVADGAGATFSSLPVPSYYTDKDELYNFPMSYPQYDSTSFRFSTLSTTLIPSRYSKTGHRATVVDGWGTITTPYGTDNCLRLVTTQYSMDSIITTLGPISIPFGFPNYVRSYQWLTLSSKIPYFEITGSLVGSTFTPTEARYRGYPQSTGIEVLQPTTENVALYPNPAKDRLWLTYKGTAAWQAEVYDAQGRLVKQWEAGTAARQGFDVSDLAPGAYLVKLRCSGKPDYLKFIKN